MKRLLLFLTTVVFCLRGISQEPVSFNYQAIVHNAKGEVVASHIASFKLSILEGNAYDTVVYNERHIVTTNQFVFIFRAIVRTFESFGGCIFL